MTGVSVSAWRAGIGLFNRKIICKNIVKGSKNYDCPFIVDHFRTSMNLLGKPFEILFSLLLLFSYCTMVVTLIPIFTAVYLYKDIINFIFFTRYYHPLKYNIFLHPIQIFLWINLIPKNVSYATKCSFSFYKKSVPGEVKNIVFFIIVMKSLLILSGTVEINPGPVTKKTSLSFAVWNLDSIPARDYARIPLIESFQATYEFDIFGVCESLLNKDIPNDDIYTNGFSPEPFRADKPENSRNGGVCLYFKDNLPIHERPDLETLPETIVAEIKLNRKKIFFILSYCHPNLSTTELEEYTKSLEHIYGCISKENPAVTILTGDFNARSPLFWESDIENREGRVFNNFLLSNNLDELINEPTHIRDDGSQSCIDLICTDQPFIFTDTGVLQSLDPHSKHKIIYSTLNFHTPCPPPL